MDLENIKRGLRGEIEKRKNESYFTFQTNILRMCEDCLDKLEELEKENINLKRLLSESDHKSSKCEKCGCAFNVPQATLKLNHCVASDLNITKGLCVKCSRELVEWLNSKENTL